MSLPPEPTETRAPEPAAATEPTSAMAAVAAPVGTITEPVALEQPTAARATWRAFRRQPLGMMALAVMGLLVAVALTAPWLAEYPSGYGTDLLAAPSITHPFGTDALGRDVLAEVLWGTRQSLAVAAAASLLAIVVGTTVAVVAAYFRRLDAILSTLVDLMLSLPVLPLMILVAALVGPSTTTIIVVIAAFSWPEVTRVVRSQALTVVGLPYVDAARLMTTSPWWIISRHVLPAVTPVIAVSVVLTASRAVLSAAGLAFLGLGDPNTWSWGRILYEAQQSGAMSSAWWLTMFPSLAILALVLSATLLATAYNDARNPRRGGRK